MFVKDGGNLKQLFILDQRQEEGFYFHAIKLEAQAFYKAK